MLFPILPGDSLLFVAGRLPQALLPWPPMGGDTINFQLWQLLVFIPIAAILGGQVGYWIGRNLGTAMFKPNASDPQAEVPRRGPRSSSSSADPSPS